MFDENFKKNIFLTGRRDDVITRDLIGCAAGTLDFFHPLNMLVLLAQKVCL